MNNDIKVIINCIQYSAKFFRRDYLEICDMKNKNASFIQLSETKLRERLVRKIGEYYPCFLYENHLEDLKQIKENDHFVIVDCVDGIVSFGRALPFFSINVSFNKKVGGGFTIRSGIIYFIATDDFYYSTGLGTTYHQVYSTDFNQEYVIKPAKVSCSNYPDYKASVIFSDLHSINFVQNISKNIYLTNSVGYSLATLIAGKADICAIENKNNFTDLWKFLTRNSGGSFIETNDIILFGNSKLLDNIKAQ